MEERSHCLIFDPFAGISGDMILGALLDAGLKLEELKRELGRLNLKGYRIEARRVMRGGLGGTRAGVRLGARAGKGVRGLDDIRAILRRSRLHPDIVQHGNHRIEHHGRTAHIILDLSRVVMP